MVARLAAGDATVNELAAPFDLTLPGISKHLKVLERCGVISRSRRAQFRPCHLEWDALDSAVSWLEDNRRVWGAPLDHLDEHPPVVQQRSGGPGGATDEGVPGARRGGGLGRLV